MAEGTFQIFVVNPTIISTRPWESMFYIDYELHQSKDWGIYLEIKVEELCSMKLMKIHDHMEKWDELFKENK